MCRTAALGGHSTQCDHCGHEAQASNSCRHRSCPTCHGAAQAIWLAAREGEVLDTPYVHGIFTLPPDRGPLVLQNPRQLYGVLLRTVAQTLQDIALDPTPLGAEIGGLAVLHTWGQQLHHHPHLHCVLPAGVVAAPCIYLAHRRPDRWPEPERFRPERFLETKPTPYEFLPFGGGVRRCLGMAFALVEMKIVLAEVLSRVELRTAPGYQVRVVRRSVTLAPSEGMPVVVERRAG